MVEKGYRHLHVSEVPESSIERELAAALGRRLAELREARGLTQERVAEAAGISRNHYQLLEYGLSRRTDRKPANPRLSTLIALSEVLGTTIRELIQDIHEEALAADGRRIDNPRRDGKRVHPSLNP